ILGQLVNIFRTSVVEAFMPSMSRMEAAGDLKSMMEMNARANAMVGMLLLPMLGFVFAFAEDLVSVVYTAAYVGAAPVVAAGLCVAGLPVRYAVAGAPPVVRLAIGAAVLAAVYGATNWRNRS